MTMENELLFEKIDRPEGGSLGTAEVEMMSRVISSSARRPYGLALVARCWKVSRATLYRRRDASTVAKRRPV